MAAMVMALLQNWTSCCCRLQSFLDILYKSELWALLQMMAASKIRKKLCGNSYYYGACGFCR
jgi:hypothetical protein